MNWSHHRRGKRGYHHGNLREALVQAALSTVLADRTAIIIAHRLSTVEIADRVLVLQHGEIVEDGRPDVLVRGGGRYADLHRAWIESLA